MTTDYIEIRDITNVLLIHRLPIHAHHQIVNAAVCGVPVKSSRNGYDFRPVPRALRQNCEACR